MAGSDIAGLVKPPAPVKIVAASNITVRVCGILTAVSFSVIRGMPRKNGRRSTINLDCACLTINRTEIPLQ
jgi:hypothetical protein